MSLETTLTDIVACLRQGRFPNEQAISRGSVLHVPQELARDNLNNVLKKTIIPFAAEVAGLTFGRDVIWQVR
jgi:hypothetical protein